MEGIAVNSDSSFSRFYNEYLKRVGQLDRLIVDAYTVANDSDSVFRRDAVKRAILAIHYAQTESSSILVRLQLACIKDAERHGSGVLQEFRRRSESGLSFFSEAADKAKKDLSELIVGNGSDLTTGWSSALYELQNSIYGPAGVVDRLQSFLSLETADEQPTGSKPGKKADTPKKKRGRPSRTPEQIEEDQQVLDAWETRNYPKYEELGREIGKSAQEVEDAVRRQRKYLSRVKKDE